MMQRVGKAGWGGTYGCVPVRVRSQKELATGGTRGSWPAARDTIGPVCVCARDSRGERTGGGGYRKDQGAQAKWSQGPATG